MELDNEQYVETAPLVSYTELANSFNEKFGARKRSEEQQREILKAEQQQKQIENLIFYLLNEVNNSLSNNEEENPNIIILNDFPSGKKLNLWKTNLKFGTTNVHFIERTIIDIVMKNNMPFKVTFRQNLPNKDPNKSYLCLIKRKF